MEDEIRELIEETATDMGLELVQVRMKGSGDNKILELLLDRLDQQKITVGECRKYSKQVSAILDVEDVIPGKYFLEVSSAGAERPLIKLEDYKRFKGRHAKITLKQKMEERARIQGEILEASDGIVKVMPKDSDEELSIEFDNIQKAKLKLTDSYFRELLNKKN